MFKSLWGYVKKSLFGNKSPEKPKFHVRIEVTKPDPNYKPLPKQAKPPKPIPEQPPLNCPYCEYVFDKVSGSKRKCPKCRGEIVVRTDNGVKLLFTPEGAEQFEAGRQRRYNRNNLIRDYVGWMNGESFDERKSIVENETSRVLTDEEFTLFLLNAELERKEVQDNVWFQRGVYFTIARLHEQMSLDPYEPKAAFFRCDLLNEAQQYGSDSKVKVRTRCECDNCKKVDGKIMTIQEALIKMPLPVRGCEMDISARYENYIGDENSRVFEHAGFVKRIIPKLNSLTICSILYT